MSGELWEYLEKWDEPMNECETKKGEILDGMVVSLMKNEKQDIPQKQPKDTKSIFQENTKNARAS